ncbi:sensor histidine kinase [Amycolatopsis sp. NPDC051371]|uniref:sensor histidine kinase n=1 Tax=Amycolatopsis sp. NPDC051371 TaxID=3155800 RepID=UPI0034379353
MASETAQPHGVHRFARTGHGPGFWILLWAGALAAEFGALVPVLFPNDAPAEAIDVAFRLIGGSFAACGLIAWRRRPDNHSGLLMTVTGFAFFVSPLLSQVAWPPAQVVALWLPDLWVLPFVLLVLTFLTGGRVRTTADRVLAGAVLLELAVLAPLYLLFAGVPGNPVAFWPHERIAEIVDVAQRGTLLAAVAGTAAVVAMRWRSASKPGRRALVPAVAGAACLVLFGWLLAAQFLTGEKSMLLLWIGVCSLLTVPIAFLVGLLRSRLARGGLADLFRGLRTVGPDDLRGALAKALGDPDLEVGYATTSDTGSYTDLDGRPVPLPGAGAGRSVSVVERDGRRVAVLVYDRSLDDDPELVDAVTAAATIALENQHLHTEARRRLAEVEHSRERIIAAGDAERRRIERNLHDGAQQGLVTLAMQLSLIQRQIRSDPADAEQLVTSASDQLAQSLAELRELARGIHPAALDQGLDVALEALATRSAVPTTVACEPGPRLPQPIEFAAYFVASEALANAAKHARAGVVTVRLRRAGPKAVIEIADDGVGGVDPAAGSGLRGLTDRVEALRGQLTVVSPAGGGTVVRAELPVRTAETTSRDQG